MSSRRADAAIMHSEPPWDSLLAGVRPDSLVLRELFPLAQYYRAKGLTLAFTLDLTNGLDRAAESERLTAAGRSLREPAIQRLARAYAVAVDTLLHPAWLGGRGDQPHPGHRTGRPVCGGRKDRERCGRQR